MNDLTSVFSCLVDKDVKALQSIATSLNDAWHKRQVFRTETEALVSVLNDGKHPTNASKYWQSVREQMVMLDNLTSLSFDMRRLHTDLRRQENRLANEELDEFDREDVETKIDEIKWQIASAEQVAHDRVREIMMWEAFKKELDNGTFDTKNVNTHQLESLRITLQNRKAALTSGSSQAEVLNVLGPLKTAERVTQDLIRRGVTAPKPNGQVTRQ